MSLVLKSYAKLNLVLDVLGKRSDGFHELATIFERIDLHDIIELKKRADGKIKLYCAHPQVPTGKSNLCYKAALYFQEKYGVTQGVDIHITKRIPVAAGLAGGSSNGATVLMGLNRLWQMGLSQNDLLDAAALLGSDVAFFIYGVPYALGRGRGEKLQRVNSHLKLWHVLVTPRVKMYTKEVFAALGAPAWPSKMPLTNKRDNVNILLPILGKEYKEQVGGALSNGLEPAILKLRPGFYRLKQALIDAGSVGVCFSGSGPSIFALAQSKAHAEKIKAAFDRRFAQVVVVSTAL